MVVSCICRTAYTSNKIRLTATPLSAPYTFMNIKHYLWIIPFLSFIFGYAITAWFFRVESIPTPHVVGKQVHEILPIISHYRLNVRLINQKEEIDLPEGIILNQTPTPGTAIKPHQPLFIVTTKKPIALQTPHCIGIPINQLITRLQEQGIHPRIYTIPHIYPINHCFAQSPEPQEPLEKNRLILYVSSGNNKPIIWPNFIGYQAEEVKEFLHNYNIDPYIVSDFPHNQNGTIIDQRPVAGTLLTMDLQKPVSVQLRTH